MTIEQTDYRIEFSIQRRLPGEEDFTEIGFGSSGEGRDLDACTHSIDSGITNGEWETTGGMPAPEDVMADISRARHG
ncbi:hypothetical protein [Nocardioides sp. Leaf285]|uniref:hypothetical protein n=1 Tax=Nocardioides sp. Leaf285 TaxID=1736322 RepID=UPI0007025C95|nr:hypothetical protein [Nocardioides sp. Leaf285]KQP63038.1 hypothetical protein ASF47_18680 [Nocardioides sp. Leaf285]